MRGTTWAEKSKSGSSKEMPEGDQDQNAAEASGGGKPPPAEEQERAAAEFHERDRCSRDPERPRRQESVRVGLHEERPGVLRRPQREDLPPPGRGEDPSEYDPDDERRQRPRVLS